ncbi:MAG: TIGR02186 family protein [Candidatus Korobacteraceae bacterium]|jgi:uncharacterized protein (TIGR02186 family)
MALRSWQSILRFNFLPALAAVLATIVCPSASAEVSQPVTLKLTPETIEMGAFYNGSRLQMEGTAPSGSKIMVVLRGVSTDEVFNKKERVGPIWINVDKVHVTGPPSLFLRFSSEDVHTFLDRETIDAYALDELSIRNRMHIRTEHGLRDPEALKLIGDHYLDLKKEEGRYRRIADRVHVVEIGNGEARYTLDIGWPKLATPGSYQVEVYACRNDRVIGQSGATLKLVEVGFPAFMANAAREHPYEYGILAVILAVIAGFGIDALAVLFGGAKKRIPAEARPILRPEPAQRAMAARAGAGATAALAQDGGVLISQPGSEGHATATSAGAGATRSSDMGP